MGGPTQADLETIRAVRQYIVDHWDDHVRDTIIGPMFLAYAVAEGGSSRFYLTVGRTF